ncbi:MAG: thioredoxin [Pseudomonadota bacterium]
MNAEHVFTDSNFETLVGRGVALVDFWAPWCTPCRLQGPIVEKTAEKFQGQAVIGKMNVDENPEAPRRFGVKAIPTLILFRDGREVTRLTGLQQEGALAQALEQALGSN